MTVELEPTLQKLLMPLLTKCEEKKKRKEKKNRKNN